jgi:hypothetical protein
MPLLNMNMRLQVQALLTHHHIRITTSSSSSNKDIPTCDEEADDNASVASTVSTTSSQLSFSSQEDQEVHIGITRSGSSCSSLSSLSSSSKRTKKSVGFDERRNVAYDNAQICHEDTLEFWYSPQDYCRFKESTLLYGEAMVLAIERQQQGYGGAAAGGCNSYERVVKRVHMACCQQAAATTGDGDESSDDNDQQLSLPLARQLNRWMSNSTAVNRLGMERLLVRQIRKERSKRRKDVVRAVLEIQDEQEQLATNNWNHQCTNNDYDNVAERMRQASQSLSLPSRLFSRHLAQAASAFETY